MIVADNDVDDDGNDDNACVVVVAAAADADAGDKNASVCAVYVLPEVGMLTTLVYKLTGRCENYMKSEKLGELEQFICPASRKQATLCRYQLHAVCDQTAPNVSA